MKGIETKTHIRKQPSSIRGSDHCPAMKGIETHAYELCRENCILGSDHCPAMKGIETQPVHMLPISESHWKRPLPRNEGD